MLEEGTLEVGGEKAVLNVHARGERLFGDLAEDEGLVGGLLGVLGEHHDPAGIEGGVDVVVPAVYVESMFGQGSGGDLQHHGREFSGGVVVLLDAVDDALSRSEVDGTLPGD